MSSSTAWLGAAIRSGALRPRRPTTRPLRGDRGEGVISAAIAVLIVAFLGAAMWMGFRQIFKETQNKVCDQVAVIGGDSKTATGSAECRQ